MGARYALVLLLSVLAGRCCFCLTCEDEFAVDITDGEVMVLPENGGGSVRKFNVTFGPADYYYHRRRGDETDTRMGCVCNLRSCLRKCCPVGMYMNRTCQTGEMSFAIPENRGASLDRFFVVSGNRCRPGKQRLLVNPETNHTSDDFYIKDDGTLYFPALKLYYSQDEYCVDYIDYEGDFAALICTDPDDFSPRYLIGMIISMPFLLVTFVVYAALPDRKLHGKALMCYVISLFCAYVLLVFIQLNPNPLEDSICKAVGILCVLFFMISFFWMNVMSIDIWWAFSGLRGFSGSKKEAERKRFLLYSAYALGVPLLLVGLISYLTASPSIPSNAWYNPGIGSGQCWFRDGIATLLYFYGPMGALILANIIFFAVTAWKIKQVQQDTAVLRKDESKKHSYENDKQRFNLYVKLLLAMGVNWSMEIISWAVDWQIGNIPPAVWYLTDFCNALYGVFIFFIFVFKQNIWKLLKRRYYIIMGKPHLARSMTQTAYSPRTTGSSLSQTDKTFVNDSSILTSEVA